VTGLIGIRLALSILVIGSDRASHVIARRGPTRVAGDGAGLDEFERVLTSPPRA